MVTWKRGASARRVRRVTGPTAAQGRAALRRHHQRALRPPLRGARHPRACARGLRRLRDVRAAAHAPRRAPPPSRTRCRRRPLADVVTATALYPAYGLPPRTPTSLLRAPARRVLAAPPGVRPGQQAARPGGAARARARRGAAGARGGRGANAREPRYPRQDGAAVAQGRDARCERVFARAGPAERVAGGVDGAEQVHTESVVIQ
ncbi:hypothetical protein B0H17DRAFT_644043 [Mycena rosella]|uniref:Uncharacterized protein n=1 Tax=Mycena rosella TaxID=1033263 RepID=A0AAD7BF81_MYCRO|nr:hypothetical protein B0H17DRAFT_644043 [Mycena rosella]